MHNFAIILCLMSFYSNEFIICIYIIYYIIYYILYIYFISCINSLIQDKNCALNIQQHTVLLYCPKSLFGKICFYVHIQVNEHINTNMFTVETIYFTNVLEGNDIFLFRCLHNKLALLRTIIETLMIKNSSNKNYNV